MSRLVCEECDIVFSDYDDVPVDGEDPIALEFCHLMHNQEGEKVKCPGCRKEMVWTVEPERERKINATFDYAFQVYRDKDGNALETQMYWDFPCPTCHGPARLDYVTCYHEANTCLECGRKFDVK